MSIQQAIAIEIERETANTKRILNVIPNDQLSYKPHPKSMSLGELANHVVELHNWIHMVFTTDVFDFHTDYAKPEWANKEALLAALEQGAAQNLTTVAALTDATYFSNWTLKAGEHVIIEAPKAGAFRFVVANHLIHHRGQLTVYLRLLDIPLPGIYGPSADEQ
jgi:uncharacterized damage-inducible protein DinB